MKYQIKLTCFLFSGFFCLNSFAGTEFDTRLLKAVIRGKPQDVKIVKMLLKQGADVNTSNASHTTALMFAAQYSNIENKDDAHEDLVNVLLENHAKINLQDDDGYTAFMYAVSLGREKIAKILMDQEGIQLDLKT